MKGGGKNAGSLQPAHTSGGARGHVGDFRGCEAAAERVLGDRARDHELEGVVRAAGLGADAGELEAAEGLAVHERAGDLAVDVEVADAELAADAVDRRGAAGVDAAGEGIFRAVGDGEGFGGVACADRGEGGAEDLFLSDRRGRGDVGEDVGGDEISIMRVQSSGFRVQGVDEAGFALAGFDVLKDALVGVVVDDGADEVGGVFGGADLHALGHFDEAVYERVIDRTQHDDARAGGALLAGVAEGAGGDAVDGFVEVGVFVHDDGVLPAQLSDDALDVLLTFGDLGGGAVDREADGARAGEGDHSDVGVVHQGWADLFADAGEEVDDAGGETDFGEDLHQLRRDDGGLFRGFHDGRVAGDEGGDGHAAEDGDGEVPGGDDDGDAAGLVGG